jgi:hypothetical protein
VAAHPIGMKVPVEVPPGFLFANTKAPLQVTFHETKLGPKHGKAEVHFVRIPFLGFLTLAWGEASIESAARDGQIATVNHTDYELLNVLGIYARFTTHAYGN